MDFVVKWIKSKAKSTLFIANESKLCVTVFVIEKTVSELSSVVQFVELTVVMFLLETSVWGIPSSDWRKFLTRQGDNNNKKTSPNIGSKVLIVFMFIFCFNLQTYTIYKG